MIALDRLSTDRLHAEGHESSNRHRNNNNYAGKAIRTNRTENVMDETENRGQTNAKWIPCGERMPRKPDYHENCSHVVVVAEILKDGAGFDAEIVNIGFARQTAFGTDWMERDSSSLLPWIPTHWYPLPVLD
jgi:Protein of unknown function (DUF551)